MQEVYDHSPDLKIVGIVCPKEGSNAMTLSTGVAYTKELTQYVIETAEKSEIVEKQMADRDVNVFSGKRFDDEEKESGLDFQDMISVDTDMLSSAFGVNINENDIANLTSGYMQQISSSITADTSAAENAFNSTLITMASDMLNDYIDAHYDAAMKGAMISMNDVESVVNSYMQTSDCKKLLANLEATYLIPQDTFSTMYSELLKGILQGYIGMASQTPGMGTGTGNSEDNGSGSDPGNIEDNGSISGSDNENTDDTSDGKDTDTNAITGSDSDTNTKVTVQSGTSGTPQISADLRAPLTKELVAQLVPQLTSQDAIVTASDQIAAVMTEAVM